MYNRRDHLCDAAITVIARAGMRGLTHRAVDRAAELPEGSASYYFRTRLALLTAVTHRLVELDTSDPRAAAGVVPAAPIDLDAIAALVTSIVVHWVGPGRDRMLARYEISLLATREPELRRTLLNAGTDMREQAIGLMVAVGASDPPRQGRDLVAVLDGLIYDQLAGAGGPRTARQIQATIREVLRGMIGH